MVERTSGSPADPPSFADLWSATVYPDEEDLRIGLELDGDVPASVDPARETLTFVVLLDRDGDGRADHRVEVSSANGWRVAVWDVATGLPRLAGTARLRDGSVRFRLPLDWIAFRGVVRYQVIVRWRERDDPAARWSVVEDRVPDGDGSWIRVGSYIKP